MGDKPEESKSGSEGIVDKIKSGGEGILGKIENFFTAGYGKKEDLRELDKALREQYYSEMIALRHRWEKVYLEALEMGQYPTGKECKKAIQTMDRLSFAINRADYGYAPLFDRVDKIQEQSLTRVLEYDKTLASNLIQLGKDVDAAEASVGQADWPQLRTSVATLRKDLSVFDEVWRNRKQAMTGS